MRATGNIISVLHNLVEQCTGCLACKDICPVNCISYKLISGFYYPIIDAKNCLECGRCIQVCPSIEESFDSNNRDPIAYSLKSRDNNIREASSSGGFFYHLAEWWLSYGGYVCGVVLDESLHAKHIISNNRDDLLRMTGAKYIQSETSHLYSRILSLLDNNERVMFVGTPCQCRALLNYCGRRRREKLLMIDFICHGVPSQDLFTRSIRDWERIKGISIKTFSFRYKNYERLRSCRLTYADGQEEVLKPEDVPYYNSFLNHTTYRPSCFTCIQRRKDRISDFTIGDDWGATMNDDFNWGYSIVICWTEIAKTVFDTIRDRFSSEKISLTYISNTNSAFAKFDKRGLDNRLFLQLYDSLNYRVLRKLFLQSNPNILVRGFRSLLRLFS